MRTKQNGGGPLSISSERGDDEAQALASDSTPDEVVVGPEEWPATIREAAQFFDVSVNTVDNWIIRGCPVRTRNERGNVETVDLRLMFHWRIQREEPEAWLWSGVRVRR